MQDENSNFSTEQLIAKIKSYPILYDMGHKDYKDTKKKDETWRKIGTSLKLDQIILKKKWKNLRDCYSKYLKSTNTNIGQGTQRINRYRNWPWAKQMEAFRSHLYITEADSNIRKVEIIEQAGDNTFGDTIASNDDGSDTVLSSDTDNSHSYLSRLRKSHRTKYSRKSSPVDVMINYLENKRNRTDLDAIELIFLGYAKTIKTFPVNRQIKVKMEIANVIMRNELENIEELEESSISYNLVRADNSIKDEPEDLEEFEQTSSGEHSRDIKISP